MTRDSTPVIGAAIDPVIRDRIRDLRERAGLDRDELAAAARDHGAGDKFTSNVVGFLERGRRGLTVQELLAVAAALECSPVELLGDAAALFIGAGVPAPVCPTCTPGEAGPMAATVRDDVASLGDLGPLEPTLVATALRLAAAVDATRGADEAKELPKLTRELRATVEQIAAGRRIEPPDDDDDDLDDLDEPE